MTVAALAFPRILRMGGGCSRDLAAVLRQLGLSRPLVVTGRRTLDCGTLTPIFTALAEAGMSPGVFADTVPDPTTQSVNDGLAALRQGDYDSIVAIGGGSPMDTAKAMSVLAAHGGQMRDYKVPAQTDLPGLPLIAIPTTAGTGSEVSRVTVIIDSDTDEKMLCSGLAFVPAAALVDYQLTFSMPRRLTADTGIDSLTHAIEAYVGRRANAFSDTMALSAMARISGAIRTACAHPDDHAAREAMMLGATEAGLAFSNASVALVHGMSRPLGALFKVPHGLSNAMLLPVVTAYSASAAPGRYAACARAMGLATAAQDDETAVRELVDGLRRLNGDLDVPSPAAWGIDRARYEDLLPTMAAQALASGSPANNPRIPDTEELIALYRRAYSAT